MRMRRTARAVALEFLHRLLRGLDWFTWLRWPLMGLGLVVIALIIATGTRECRTGRLILGTEIDESARIDIDMLYFTEEAEAGDEERREPIYHGDASFRSPFYVPILSRPYAGYEVTVTFPDGRQIESTPMLVSGIASTDYIFIGRKEIIFANAWNGFFNFKDDEESVRRHLSLYGFLFSDIWSCVI